MVTRSDAWREMDDDGLIASCRAGDQAAWAEVVRRYERLVLHIARSYGLPQDRAQDVAQVTFTILVQSLPRLQPGTRLAPWLSTVTRRHTWRALAAWRRESPDDAAHDDRPGGAGVPADELHRADWVRDGLSVLDSRCRVLLEALFLRPDPPSYQDLSAELGVPVGSLGPTRARCLDRLRALLEATDADRPLDRTTERTNDHGTGRGTATRPAAAPTPSPSSHPEEVTR